MTAYYNEIDPFAAAWLRELIKAGLIAPGDVDERSIEDVTPMDLRGYTQCHFFAGVGGWSFALRLAGWPEWGQDTERREHEFNGADARRQEATGGYTMGGEIDNPWRNPEWLPCRDGKARPTQPGLSPLAYGLPERVVRGSNQGAPINADDSTEARVMRLRGYGNAIVPQVAAEFITAYRALRAVAVGFGLAPPTQIARPKKEPPTVASSGWR